MRRQKVLFVAYEEWKNFWRSRWDEKQEFQKFLKRDLKTVGLAVEEADENC